MQKHYDSLYSEMYNILYSKVPREELDFYLDYAKAEDKIFLPLCENDRFVTQFTGAGYNIISSTGVECDQDQKFDYIFIPSGSAGRLVGKKERTQAFAKFYNMLNVGGKLVVFFVLTHCKAQNHKDFRLVREVNLDGNRLVLSQNSSYHTLNQTQCQTRLYELYNGKQLIQVEKVDYKAHLYKRREVEKLLCGVGFKNIQAYSDYDKSSYIDGDCDFLIYECEK